MRVSGGRRLAAALLLLAMAGWLLLPAPPEPAPRNWDGLIAPLAVGRPVARGYVLGPPRRGDGDVVYVARRPHGSDGPAARVELHIVPRGRWTGIAETRSFGIGWEAPPAAALDAAPNEDADAVRDAFAAAVAGNDPGDLSVAAIALAGDPPAPVVSRVLARLSGVRGATIGVAVALALVALNTVAYGAVAVAVVLAAIALALRAPELDVPFVRDQDVQRLFTGHLSLHEIATGAGLKDRHPPLYFFVLHAVQLLGQSEAIGRVPAVIAGTLVGPAILLAARWMCGRVEAAAVLAALAATVSPDLVASSREVSEIPLFALLVIAATAALVAAVDNPRPARLVALAAAHTVSLFTYYLAPLVGAAHALVLAWKRPKARVIVAFAVGLLAGLPALALAALTLRGDAGARAAAQQFPLLAWGAHAPGQMLADMGRIAVAAFGMPFLVSAVGAAVVGLAQRNLAVVATAATAAAVAAGIAALSPIARVQAYYVSTVLPLLALVIAVTREPRRPPRRTAWLACVLAAVACGTVPSLAGIRSAYVPDAAAFMPRFAAAIAARPEPTVVVIAHYDKALLAYYLARGEGRPVDWQSMEPPGARRIEPLIMVHAVSAGFEAEALRRLEEILAAGPALVIERDAVAVPIITQRLQSCERLLEAPSARLLRCAG